MSCPVCDDLLYCPEHPDPCWPEKNEWSVMSGTTYQGVPYYFHSGPRRISFAQAAEEVKELRTEWNILPKAILAIARFAVSVTNASKKPKG